jgi:hypothetical protein
MFSHWIVTNITSAHGTVHCLKTRISCGDQLVIRGQSDSSAEEQKTSCPYYYAYSVLLITQNNGEGRDAWIIKKHG